MKIIHRYVLSTFFRLLGLCLATLLFLFIAFDLFDRIDNFIEAQAKFVDVLLYFAYKVPLILNLMLPISVMLATLLTLGILSRNSEITAMRAQGLKVLWIALPVLVSSFVLSIISIAANETIVPYATRRVNEIHDFDIKKKDETGRFSQTDFWWREDNNFYSVNIFDSRKNTLHKVSELKVDPNFNLLARMDADHGSWMGSGLGWNLTDVRDYSFSEDRLKIKDYPALPLTIKKEPQDFYNVKMDTDQLSFRELKKFITEQKSHGLNITSYLSDLYAKFSFPFIIFVVSFMAIPFAIRPARTGNMTFSFLAGITIGFTYYAMHSISIALGRAEFLPPVLAAWFANIFMLAIGFVLSLSIEAPD